MSSGSLELVNDSGLIIDNELKIHGLILKQANHGISGATTQHRGNKLCIIDHEKIENAEKILLQSST